MRRIWFFLFAICWTNASAAQELCCECKCNDGLTAKREGTVLDSRCDTTCGSVCNAHNGTNRIVSIKNGSCQAASTTPLPPDKALLEHVYWSIARGGASVFAGPLNEDIKNNEELRQILMNAQDDTSASGRNQSAARQSIQAAPLPVLRAAVLQAVQRCQSENASHVFQDLQWAAGQNQNRNWRELEAKFKNGGFDDIRNSFRIWQQHDAGRRAILYCYPSSQITEMMNRLGSAPAAPAPKPPQTRDGPREGPPSKM